MALKYKLYYFDAKAMGEPIRFLLSYGNVDYEDFRFDKVIMWPKIKPNMPFGQTPVLEFNGIKSYQSIAICRYLAKQLHLMGANDIEDLEIDAVVDTIVDLRIKMGAYYYEQNEEIKKKLKDPLFEHTIPFYLERLEAFAKSNNGYLAAGKLTWADIYFIALLDYLNFLCGKKIIEDYPTLVKLEEKVLNFDGIKAWVKIRPYTDR